MVRNNIDVDSCRKAITLTIGCFREAHDIDIVHQKIHCYHKLTCSILEHEFVIEKHKYNFFKKACHLLALN